MRARLLSLAVLLASSAFFVWSADLPDSGAYFFDTAASRDNVLRAGLWVTPTPNLVQATVDLKPDSLGKKSEGAPVTAFIKLPSPYAADQIDVASLRLTCVAPTGVGGCSGAPLMVDPKRKPKTEDSDGNGIEDTLKVTFDRQAVIELVRDVKTPALVEFAVTGRVSNSPFEGRDVVKLVDPEPAPSATPTPTASPTHKATLTATPTATAGATATAASTATPTAATTSTPLPTATPSPTFTVTPTPTGTATATRTSTPVPLPSLLTPTAGPTGTAVPLPPALEVTATPTGLPTATGAPAPLPTSTPTATNTPVPTSTVGATATPQPTPLP